MEPYRRPGTLLLGTAAAACLAAAWLAPLGSASPPVSAVAFAQPLTAQAPDDGGDSGSDGGESSGSEDLCADGGCNPGTPNSLGGAASPGGGAAPAAEPPPAVTGPEEPGPQELPGGPTPPVVPAPPGPVGQTSATGGGSGDDSAGGVSELIDTVLSGVMALLDKLIP